VKAPFDIVCAAHTELVVADLRASRRFYVDLLGFVVTEESRDRLWLRGYEERCHHSLVLREGERPIVDHLAYRVAAPEDLDRAAEFFAARGCDVRWLAAGEEVGQGEAIRVCDPLGFPIELFRDIEPSDSLLQRFDLHRGPQILRMDHFNVLVCDVEAAVEHYRTLGFRCSEYIAADPPDDQLFAAWMFRKPTVHDVALTGGDGPRLHHLGFVVPDTTAVLRACDILAAAGETGAIERGPGRHGASNAFFVYLRDPDGHRIELYTGDYLTAAPDLEPIRWSVNDPRRRSFWGQPVPESWYAEASLVAGPDGAPQPVAALDVMSEATAEAI
jgi:3,4-dihydroxyphenylacetate 2,3-dioxygenase